MGTSAGFWNNVYYSIRNTDFTTRSGAYLFTIGNADSGKTTLHQYILKWLNDNTTLELIAVDEYYGPVATINDFIEKADKGLFSHRTPVGHPTELKIRIHPVKSPPLELGLFEISGEDIKGVIPTHQKPPEIPEKLNEALGCRNIKFAFIFVSDADEARKETFNEDKLFSSFLDYVNQRFTHLHRAPLLLVVSKWYGKTKTEFSDKPEEYVRKMLPGTFQRLKLRKKQGINHAIVPHYLGTHVERMEDGMNIRVITKKNMETTEKITKWVYRNFKQRDMDGRNMFVKFFDKVFNPLQS